MEATLPKKGGVLCVIEKHTWRNKLCHVLKHLPGNDRPLLLRCIAKEILFTDDFPHVPMLRVEYFYKSKWKSKCVDILLTMSINLFWIDQVVVSEEDELEVEEETMKTHTLRQTISSSHASMLRTENNSYSHFELPSLGPTIKTDNKESNKQILQRCPLTVLPTLAIEADIILSKLTLAQSQQLSRVLANTNAMLNLLTAR